MQSRFLLLIGLVSLAGTARAQAWILPQKRLTATIPSLRYNIIDTTGNELQPPVKTMCNNNWLAGGRLSHSTPNGKVYIMPFDNTPCLAPDLKKVERMPGIRPVPQEHMPNAFPKSRRNKD